MKKLIIILSFLTAAAVVLVASGFINAVLLFIVVGVVPGTDYIVPASTMLTAIVAVSWIVLLPFVSIKGILRTIARQLEKSQTFSKKHLTHRRFSKA